MIDIVSNAEGTDMGVFDTQTCKAANILSVQLGALEYSPQFGIDLKYFLSEEFRFQNTSFKSYLVEILANNKINVSSVLEVLNSLFGVYTFNISADDKTSGLIAR